jgi:hypothetical protein
MLRTLSCPSTCVAGGRDSDWGKETDKQKWSKTCFSANVLLQLI